MTNVVSFDDSAAARMVRWMILGYLGDPPESDFQIGYLAACLDIYREVFGRDGDDRIKLAAGMIYPDERAGG